MSNRRNLLLSPGFHSLKIALTTALAHLREPKTAAGEFGRSPDLYVSLGQYPMRSCCVSGW
jgi:hypothetical protein